MKRSGGCHVQENGKNATGAFGRKEKKESMSASPVREDKKKELNA